MNERIFLLKSPPDKAARWKPQEIRLGWLEAGSREIIVGDFGGQYSLSISLLTGAAGQKRDLPLSKSDFAALWPETEGRRLRLERARGRIGALEICLDSFRDGLAGLELARLTGLDPSAGRSWPELGFLGTEVGYDPRFAWSALARGSVAPETLRGTGEEDFTGAIGVVPYMRTPEGLKIILCTSPRRDRWIFPKGQNKPELALRDVALMEAAEEAGLIGEVTGEPILCSYLKGNAAQELILFPMEVKSMLRIWQESDSRDRAMFPLAELLAQPEMEGLLPGLRMVADMAVDRARPIN